MDCAPCQRTYALHSAERYWNGIRGEEHVWVLSGPYGEAKELDRKARGLKRQSLDLARTRHLGSLRARLDALSKKEVWVAISSVVPNYKSLQTFYLHTKGKSTRQIAGDLFSEHELPGVWKLLGIQDKQVTKLLSSAESLLSQAETLIRDNSSR